MSNEANKTTDIIDTLQGHGYRALSGVYLIDDFYAITVHQTGTEIVYNDVQGFRNPLLETRPIVVAGGAGRIALTFTSIAELDSLTVAESLRRRHGLFEGKPIEKDKDIPKIQSAVHAGTIAQYPSRALPLTACYFENTVRVEANINISNLDIEPVIREAVEVGGICLVGYNDGFSQTLLNSARALERLATRS